MHFFLHISKRQDDKRINRNNIVSPQDGVVHKHTHTHKAHTHKHTNPGIGDDGDPKQRGEFGACAVRW